MNRSLAVGLLVLGLLPGLVLAADSNDKKISRDIHQLKKDYQKKVDKDLREINLKIKSLKHRGLKAETRVKADINKDIKRLEAKKAGVDRKLNALKKSSGDAWKDLRQGVDDAVADLGKSVDEAVERVKGEK